MRNNLFKKIIFVIFWLMLLSLMLSGLFPQEVAKNLFYQAVWFKALWGILAVVLLINAINFSRRKFFAFAVIYFSLLVIISGGFLSSLFSEEGFFEIKESEAVNRYYIEDDVFRDMDFFILLKRFSVEFYPEKKSGMRFVKRYASYVSIQKSGAILKEAVIEVNKPLSYKGYSFYQYGYDQRYPNQTVLQVVKDPGVPLVYIGYLLLLGGMISSFKKVFFSV